MIAISEVIRTVRKCMAAIAGVPSETFEQNVQLNPENHGLCQPSETPRLISTFDPGSQIPKTACRTGIAGCPS
jgi:hypothetical protein